MKVDEETARDHKPKKLMLLHKLTAVPPPKSRTNTYENPRFATGE
jgi:hypothetical protein